MKESKYSYEYEQSIKINQQLHGLLEQLPFFCSEYLHDKRALHKYQPRTYVAYLSDVLNFFKYLCQTHEFFKETSCEKITPEQLNTLTRKDILAYLSDITTYDHPDKKILTNAESGKARKLASLRSIFSYLIGEGKMAHNPAGQVDTPSKKASDVVYMTTPQQQILLSNLENGYAYSPAQNFMHYSDDNKIHIRDMAIIYLFLGTGIRVSELVSLNMDDVNFRDRSIFVTRKGGKKQTLYFSSDVEDKLLSYLDYSRPQFLNMDQDGELIDIEALFLSSRKQRMSVRSVQSMLEKYTSYTFKDETDKKISCHKLRSTYATNLLEETLDASLVADTLGHADLSVVSKYGKAKNLERSAIDIRYKK